MIHKYEPLFARVWQEVGRHSDLVTVLNAVAAIVTPEAPVKSMEIFRFDSTRSDLEGIARSGHDGETPIPERRVGLTPAHFEALLDWCRRADTVSVRANEPWPDALLPLQECCGAGNVLIGALTDRDSQPAAIAILHMKMTARRKDVDLLRGLLEPLSVALENARRLRELSQLRVSAEANRLSLLNRMGRDTLADTIVGESGGLRTVLMRVDQVARSDSSVLLLGETGSGKEVIARAIHERSDRAHAPFIRVNCGALAPELIDSELFGHEKGSFTGAVARRKGWFEQADGGTLFLDEVGELPPAVQVRLLRVLQDGNLNRVGSEEIMHVSVRVVAATHQDLAAMVQQGGFREDLWYRIAVFPILIPSVRERPQDIPELARHFARKASARIGLHLQLPSEDDIALLQDYGWPGNVREMASVIERAAILGEGQRLEIAAALGLAVLPRPASAPSSQASHHRRAFATLDQAIGDHIRASLAHTQGRIDGRHGAARLLAMNPNTLRSRMRKLGIDARTFRESPEE